MNDFLSLKEQVKKYYESIKGIHCPYFNEPVFFASDGFHHLLFRGKDKIKIRHEKTQQLRLKLFKLAPRLLRITTTHQEYFEQNEFILIKNNKKKEKVLKPVYYWGFIAIVNGRKIKVIVKQIGQGQKRFWSLIPNWMTRKSKEQGMMIVNYTGDLEND